MIEKRISERGPTRRVAAFFLLVFLMVVGVRFLLTFDRDLEEAQLQTAAEESHTDEAKRPRVPRRVDVKPVIKEEVEHVGPAPVRRLRGTMKDVLVFYTDAVGDRVDVSSAHFLVEAEKEGRPWGRQLLMQGRADSRGRFRILASIRPPFDIHVTAPGFLGGTVKVKDDDGYNEGPLEVELHPAQSTWISVRVVSDQGGTMIDGPRIQMRIPTRCDMIRQRWRVEAYERADELPVLRAGKIAASAADGHAFFTPIHRVKRSRPTLAHGGNSLIGELKTSRRKEWLVLFWEDVAIRAAEIPGPGGVVEFVLQAGDLTAIDPTCRR